MQKSIFGMSCLIAAIVAVGPAMGQGVKDPSTPNSNMAFPVMPPSQPSRPTATPNIPPQSAAPPLGVRRAYRGGARPYYRRAR